MPLYFGEKPPVEDLIKALDEGDIEEVRLTLIFFFDIIEATEIFNMLEKVACGSEHKTQLIKSIREGLLEMDRKEKLI